MSDKAAIQPGPIRRLFLTLLLAIVATHALTPLSFRLEPTSGSAFSASTTDVAIGCSERKATERKSLPANEGAGTAALRPEPPALEIAPQPPFVGGGFGATGPPTFERTCSPLNPRAPPAA